MTQTKGRKSREALLLFARYPFTGPVKTRLAAGIGAGNARRLYYCFLKDIFAQLGRLDHGVEVFVFFTPAAAVLEFRDLFGAGFTCLPQTGDSLGERMKNAFREVFERGISRAVVIGSDLPSLGAAELEDAFDRLKREPAVIGPALDGGYYLLGLNREVYSTRVFEDISWSSPAVFPGTMQRFRELGVKPAVLGLMADIDDLADLKAFYHGGRRRENAPATVGFIDWALAGLVPYENLQK